MQTTYTSDQNSNSLKLQAKAYANIALVKYWGKKADQIPCNPSLSFTLSDCYTEIDAQLLEKRNAQPQIQLYFEGKRHLLFEKKTAGYFQKLTPYIPQLGLYDITLKSSNSFPHSSGIASSASAFAALAKIAAQISPTPLPDNEISHYARLGSGSACRSIKNGWALWGKHTRFNNSSDRYAIPYPKSIHKNFNQIQDSIIIVDSGQKAVSSSKGHSLIMNHPFAKNRFEQARQNLATLAIYIENGDWEGFGEIVEWEALTLHALMMSSQPYYILMKPDTLKIIEEVWVWRKETKIPIFFTLDAGANLHLIYQHTDRQKAKAFISSLQKEVIHNELCG